MTAPRPSAPGGRPPIEDPIAIAPDALAMAAHEFVVSAGIAGTGPDGAVTRDDLERAINERPRPMSRIRQVIARRLTESFTTTPHFSVTVSVDVTDLVAIREELKGRGFEYTVTDFITMAAARSLVEFPIVNGRTDGVLVWPRERIDVGLAVAVDGGLVVPVVRGADRLGLPDLHERIVTLIDSARRRSLAPHDLVGGTFTISNMGMLGVEHFTAIVNPGEGAILAVGSAQPSAAVVNGALAIRRVMRMTLSADHRLIDGALAASFLNGIRNRLEDSSAIEASAQLPPT